MFGFLKPKPAPDGPVVFVLDAEVAVPAQRLYDLLDWASPDNAKRLQGEQVNRLGDRSDRFELIMRSMPDLQILLTVTDQDPPGLYGYESELRPAVGKLKSSHELYRIEATGADSCRVEYTNTVEFQPGLTLKQFENEVGMMSIASHNSLKKLMLQAEEGTEAVEAANRRIVA